MRPSSPKEQIDSILKTIPGVIGLIVMDLNGNPIYTNGRIDIPEARFSAELSECYHKALKIGEKLGQPFISFLAEYESSKIYQIGFGKGLQLVLIIKVKESQFGLLKSEVNRVISEFSKPECAEPDAPELAPSESSTD